MSNHLPNAEQPFPKPPRPSRWATCYATLVGSKSYTNKTQFIVIVKATAKSTHPNVKIKPPYRTNKQTKLLRRVQEGHIIV